MNVAGVYLLHRFFYRLTDFFYHWYVSGSRVAFHLWISRLETLDRSFAVKITLRHFFEPLYQDYSVIGRVLGVFFRSGRVLLGASVYSFVTVLFALAYLAWLSVPVVILGYVFYYA